MAAPVDSSRAAVNARTLADSKFHSEVAVRLRAAFTFSRHAVLIADDHRRWVTANAAARELLGVDTAALPWQKVDDFIHPNERGRLEEDWQAFISTGAHEGWDTLYVPDREPVPVEFSATADVVPGRHLTLFIPTEDPPNESAVAREAAWRPALEEGDQPRLTEREREVMTLVASGLTNGDMGERLFLSPETVKSHVQNAMGKLSSRTRAHAVAIALVTGQITWET